MIDKHTRLYASDAAKKREKKRRLDNAVAGTSKIRRFVLTTTAGEDETSEGNLENSKREAVDVAPSVPAPEDAAAAEPAPEHEPAAVPTMAEPATVEPATADVEKNNLAAGQYQYSWLTMDNELLPHILCVFMRATSCHIFIVCVILFYSTAVCRCVRFKPIPNTFFVSHCYVCVDT